MPQELIEIIDEITGLPSGKILPRHEVISNGHWCRTTDIFVLNSEGKVLCHQRSLNKERKPGVWSTHFGGHVCDGETYKSNALKELEEELGLQVPYARLIPWRTTKNLSANLFVRQYMTVFDGDITKLNIQKEEVEQVQWFTVEEILRLTKTNPEAWIAGTHDFYAEYQCLRAVLVAALNIGVFDNAYRSLEHWSPPLVVEV